VGDAGAAGDARPGAAASCSAKPPASFPVASFDLLGHPPYASDGCTLVYVVPAAAGGELRSLDLTSGAEAVVAPASESPRRPTVLGDTIAWEAQIGGRRVVRVHAAGATFTAAGAFDHAGEPRAVTDAVVFTAWTGADDTSDTDVHLLDVATRQSRAVVGGAGQQRFADVSSSTIAVTDFSEDPDGTFNDNETDLADIVLFDRATGALTHRARSGKQAFPMLASATRLGYLDWAEVHPEPKLSAYTLRVGDIQGAVTGDVTLSDVTNQTTQYVLPSGRDGIIAWVDNTLGTSPRLWRAPADLSAKPTAAAGLDGVQIYAPAHASGFTLVGTQASGAADVVLTAVAR
jgi:hypothetical protein